MKQLKKTYANAFEQLLSYGFEICLKFKEKLNKIQVLVLKICDVCGF